MAEEKKPAAAQTGTAAKQPAPNASTTTAPVTNGDEKDIERPKRKEGESDEAFKQRLIKEYHQPMLKKLSATRVPRVVTAIKTIGGLVNHKPTESQQKFLIGQLRAAVDEAEKELKGEGETAPTFSLPD